MNGKLILPVSQMTDIDTWLSYRQKGIGGTDAAAIMGLSKFKSPFELWSEKTGQTKAADLSNDQTVYWGKANEANIAKWFEEATGKKTKRCGMLQHDEYDYMLANVDRLIVGEKAGLEIKTAGVNVAKEWADNDVPNAYYVQCQWYMFITGFKKWYIAVLIGGNSAKWTEIKRDNEFIDVMVDAVKKFWVLVETKTMPPVDGTSSCSNALRNIFNKVTDTETALPAEAENIITKLHDYKEKSEALNTAITKLENELKLMLGTNEVGYIGENKVTWKVQKGRTTIDSKRLKIEQPTIYSRYARIGDPVRVLRV